MQLQPVLKALRKADQDFQLIKPKDKIAVALSGGKDSLLLALALKTYQRFDHTDFEMVAIHVDVGFDDNENRKMIDFCQKWDIPFEIVKTDIFKILKEERHTRHGKIQCSLCATLKKGVLFRKAKELGCTSVAFGHHGDDAAETMLLNLVYQGNFSTMSPRFHLDDIDLDEIRPLIYMKESEVLRYVKANGIESVKKICPNDGYTKREDMKTLLNEFYQRYPQAHDNMMLALKEKFQEMQAKKDQQKNQPEIHKDSRE